MKFIKVGSDALNCILNDKRFITYISRKIKLNFSYDVPYLCGYSKDGRTVYVDRHLKRYYKYNGKTYDLVDFLLVHEIVEKALIDLYGWHYSKAHHIATHIEALAVKQHGIDWWSYTKYLKPQIKTAYHNKIRKLPPDLDPTPYEDEGEKEILKKLGVRSSSLNTKRKRLTLQRNKSKLGEDKTWYSSNYIPQRVAPYVTTQRKS